MISLIVSCNDRSSQAKKSACTTDCECDEDVCCELDDGTYQTLPASECDAISPDPDLCLGAGEEDCCRIDGQFVNVPAGECPEGALAPADMCVEDLEICCDTATGLMTLPQSECPAGQEVAAELCEEGVCCKTADGNAYVPASQCEPMSVLPDDRCVTPEPECKRFRAVDMSELAH